MRYPALENQGNWSCRTQVHRSSHNGQAPTQRTPRTSARGRWWRTITCASGWESLSLARMDSWTFGHTIRGGTVQSGASSTRSIPTLSAIGEIHNTTISSKRAPHIGRNLPRYPESGVESRVDLTSNPTSYLGITSASGAGLTPELRRRKLASKRRPPRLSKLSPYVHGTLRHGGRVVKRKSAKLRRKTPPPPRAIPQRVETHDRMSMRRRVESQPCICCVRIHLKKKAVRMVSWLRWSPLFRKFLLSELTSF